MSTVSTPASRVAAVNPNLKHLRIFVEIARRGSFRSASQALHLSEPATSQAISQLESLLSVKLLERTTRSVRLTEAGDAFLVDAERLLDGLDHSVATLREFVTTGRGRVSLACLSSTVYRLLPQALSDLKARYPAINVVFRDDSMRGILQSLDKGECDVAIASEDFEHGLPLALPLLKDTFQVVLPAGHPLAKNRQISGAEISAQQLVLLRRGSGIRDAFDRAMEGNSLPVNIVHETTQVHTLLGLVESGLGATVLPAMLCPPDSNPAFAVRPLRKPSVARRLGIAYPPSREPSELTRVVVAAILQTTHSPKLSMPRGVTKIRQPAHA